MTDPFAQQEIWYLTGSQHLYGPEALKQVAKNSTEVVEALNKSGRLPIKLVFKPVLTTPEEIRATCIAASSTANCVGVVLWMHTFSPAKMWIAGLRSLTKPILHLHTQFNRDLPWESIDMDFMNSKSSGPRRPRGGVHSHAAAAKSQGGGRALVRSGGARSHCRLVAGRRCLGRLARWQLRSLRRQHALRGRDRRG